MSIQDQLTKNLDTIRQEMFDRLSAKQEEYAAKGWLPIRLNLNKGIVRGMIELWCWALWQLYQFLAMVLTQAFPSTATGVWLDIHCAQVSVERRPTTKATGVCYFTRASSSGNIPIPAGRIVKTRPDGAGKVYRFVTLAAAILPDGETEIAVDLVAEEYGSGSNVTAGQISEISTIIPGVDAVENRIDWLANEGVDAEGDESLRQRYQLAWLALSGCTKYAYEAWAREVVGVVGVRILDQHPRGEGTIDVVITGAAGVPTEALLASVTANILGTGAGDEKNPINDDVEIKGPVPVEVTFIAELELTGGTPAEIVGEAENRVRALFATGTLIPGIAPLGIGTDATLDRLKWAAMLPTVKRINTEFVDVVVPDGGMAVLEDISITWAWAAEG